MGREGKGQPASQHQQQGPAIRLTHPSASLHCPRNLEIFPTVSKVARAQRERERERERPTDRKTRRRPLFLEGFFTAISSDVLSDQSQTKFGLDISESILQSLEYPGKQIHLA